MEFTSSNRYFLVVEIESQILDSKDLNLVPLAPLLLEQAPKILRPRQSLEFIKSILALVALIRNTAIWLAEEVDGSSSLCPYLLKANNWQAARYGFEGRFADPTAILADHPM